MRHGLTGGDVTHGPIRKNELPFESGFRVVELDKDGAKQRRRDYGFLFKCLSAKSRNRCQS